MRVSSAYIIFIFLGFAKITMAGPFGFDFGVQVKEYDCNQLEKPGFFRCNNPPKPHSAFEFVVLEATPQRGVCWIKAVGKDINDNGFGFKTKNEVDDLETTLSKSYGQSKKTDLLLPGSIWDDADDWLIGILKTERAYAYQWETPTSSDHNLEGIFLGAGATNRRN